MSDAAIDMLELHDFNDDDTEAVVALWHLCKLTRPWNDPHKDIMRKQSTLTNAADTNNGAFWVGIIKGEIVASVMIGYEGHRGSINYLAIHPDYAGQSLGRHIMDKAEAFLIELGCPKVAFCVRKDNDAVLSFYDKLGYGIDDVYAMGKRLIPDD